MGLYISGPIDAWRIVKDTMNGKEPLHVAYLHERTAQLEADGKPKDEWTGYKVEKVKLRMLTEDEGGIGNDLVMVNKETPASILRRRALAKLSREEQVALGVAKLPLTLEEAQEAGRCRICGQVVEQITAGNPLMLDYGKEYAHEKCLTSLPK